MENVWSNPVISDITSDVSFRQNLPWNNCFRHRNYRSFFFYSYRMSCYVFLLLISILVLGYYMYRPVLAHAHRNGKLW